MKKLLTLHYDRTSHKVLTSLYINYFLVLIVGLIIQVPLYLYFLVISLLTIVIVLSSQVYDIFGEDNSFIQTLPYSRKTLIISKWLYRIIYILVIWTPIFLFFLMDNKNNMLKNYDLGNSMFLIMVLFYSIVVLTLLLAIEEIHLIIYIVSKTKRSFMKIMVSISLSTLAFGILFIGGYLLFEVNELVGLGYILLFLAIIYNLSIYLYQRLDIDSQGLSGSVYEMYFGR
ncbi:MAG: hypothetical protein RBQ97_04850 [Acholeplasma sp.]|nr:hypothetical protein [Acholeplasma sp.]